MGGEKRKEKNKRKGGFFKNKFIQLPNVIYRNIDMGIVAPLVSWLNACWPVYVYFISGWEILGPPINVYTQGSVHRRHQAWVSVLSKPRLDRGMITNEEQ